MEKNSKGQRTAWRIHGPQKYYWKACWWVRILSSEKFQLKSWFFSLKTGGGLGWCSGPLSFRVRHLIRFAFETGNAQLDYSASMQSLKNASIYLLFLKHLNRRLKLKGKKNHLNWGLNICLAYTMYWIRSLVQRVGMGCIRNKMDV